MVTLPVSCGTSWLDVDRHRFPDEGSASGNQVYPHAELVPLATPYLLLAVGQLKSEPASATVDKTGHCSPDGAGRPAVLDLPKAVEQADHLNPFVAAERTLFLCPPKAVENSHPLYLHTALECGDPHDPHNAVARTFPPVARIKPIC